MFQFIIFDLGSRGFHIEIRRVFCEKYNLQMRVEVINPKLTLFYVAHTAAIIYALKQQKSEQLCLITNSGFIAMTD